MVQFIKVLPEFVPELYLLADHELRQLGAELATVPEAVVGSVAGAVIVVEWLYLLSLQQEQRMIMCGTLLWVLVQQAPGLQ